MIETMPKIPNTNLDEQYVAFALIDYEVFIKNLYDEQIIDKEEYQSMKNNSNKIAKRCGLLRR